MELIENVILTPVYNENTYIDSDSEISWLFLQYA